MPTHTIKWLNGVVREDSCAHLWVRTQLALRYEGINITGQQMHVEFPFYGSSYVSVSHLKSHNNPMVGVIIINFTS